MEIIKDDLVTQIFFNPHTPVGRYDPHLVRNRFREQSDLLEVTEALFFPAMP